MIDLAVLAVAALAAGFIDAVAGGGGLIQVPVLFTLLPGESPAALFGTNKVSSVFGTANAAWRYGRRIRLPWHIVGPATAAALGSAYLGAATVSALPKEMVRPLVLAMLLAVFLYTALRPRFGRDGKPGIAVGHVRWVAPLAGGVLGFYDGFFGPGAGSFMIFAFIWLFGLDFLAASSAAKVVNLATNAAALAYFAPHGQVLLATGALMAVCNVVGAVLGTRLALTHGSGFVRGAFLAVMAVLIARFGYELWR